MRHSKKRHKLGRTAPHRKATLAALSTSLIAHKRITTTVAKAKALRPFLEPLITRAKDDSQHNRRQVYRHLQDKQAVTTLFTEVAEQVGDRPGGYTRVVKLGRRSGDGAALAMIELVDYNDVKPDEGGGGRRRTRRGSGKGRRRSKSKGAATTPPQPTEEATETVKQVDTAEKGTETETVEAPVSEEQATPVTERTDTGDVPEDQIEAAEEAVESQKKQAKSDQAADEETPAEEVEAGGESDAEEPKAAGKSEAAEEPEASAKADASEEAAGEAESADEQAAEAGDEEAAEDDEEKNAP